jgi:hypothetical protein
MRINIKYTLELQINLTLNYLDLRLYGHDNNITMGIRHKPSQTDMTIHLIIQQNIKQLCLII